MMHINKVIEAIDSATGLRIPDVTHDFKVKFDDEGQVTFLYYESNRKECVIKFLQTLDTPDISRAKNDRGNHIIIYQ